MVTNYVDRRACCFLKKIFSIHQKEWVSRLCIYKQINIAICCLFTSGCGAKKQQRRNAILTFKYVHILFKNDDTFVFCHGPALLLVAKISIFFKTTFIRAVFFAKIFLIFRFQLFRHSFFFISYPFFIVFRGKSTKEKQRKEKCVYFNTLSKSISQNVTENHI